MAIRHGLLATLLVAGLAPRVTAQDAGVREPSFEKHGYTFKPSEREVFYRSPDGVTGPILGKLDRNGTFLAYPKEKQPHATGYIGLRAVAINDRKRPGGDDLLDQMPAAEFVYEYRSAILIPGQLVPNGYFVPAIGAKIIRFADYIPGPSANRIYNLPGEFVPLKK